MTAHDAITRVSVDIVGLLTPENKNFSGRKYFAVGVIALAIVNFIVLTAFGANMGDLVALATFISFVMAPIVGYMNLKNVMSHDLPDRFHPTKGLQYLTYAGIVFLSLFALYYCWMLFF
jgi:Mn2+/Fe2+ NRAMP family transporter